MFNRISDTFVDDDEAKRMTATIFIVLGCMVLATSVSFLLYWAYNREPRLFSAILWTIVFLYTVTNAAFVGISKNRMKLMAFRFFIALHSAMGLMAMAIFIFYYVKASNSLRATSASPMSNYSGIMRSPSDE